MSSGPNFASEQDLRSKYEGLRSKYKRLGEAVAYLLKRSFEVENIDVDQINHRCKSYPSFLEKIIRKGCYRFPFERIEDICGARVICRYDSDVLRVGQIVDEEFEILDNNDSPKNLDPESFGYRSAHYIVRLRGGLAKARAYGDIVDLKAEIQVRTILSHAWATASHHLVYKRNVPAGLKRRLSQLSESFEKGDKELDSIREALQEFDNDSQENIAERQKLLARMIGFLRATAPIVEGREYDSEEALSMLDEISDLKLRFGRIEDGLEIAHAVMGEIEAELGRRWSQISALKVLLLLVDDDYWSKISKESSLSTREYFRRWRAEAKARKESGYG